MTEKVEPEWDVNAERSMSDPDGIWMTRTLEEGWQLHVRLITNGYHTVVDQLHIEPGQATTLHGLRGAIELPTGNPVDPDWIRIPLHTAHRGATNHLNQLLSDHREVQDRRYAYASKGLIDPADFHHREQLDHILAMHAEFKGFTRPATTPRAQFTGDRPLRLALVAAAYEHARTLTPTQPRQHVHQLLHDLDHAYAPASIGPLIHHARQEGMLTHANDRKAGGKATKRARALIKQAGIELPWETKR
jgi:hypothetical protein